MKKSEKPHHMWYYRIPAQAPLSQNDALRLLSEVCGTSLFSGQAECGERVNVLMKNGAIIRGYVSYASDFGGYFVYSSHKVNKLDETNTLPIDVNEIVEIVRTTERQYPFCKYPPLPISPLSEIDMKNITDFFNCCESEKVKEIA